MICVPFSSSRNRDRISGNLKKKKTAHNLTPPHMGEPDQGHYFVCDCFSLYLSNLVSW